MNTITSTEDAYSKIANEILAFIGNEPWDEAGAKYEIFSSMISTVRWRNYKSSVDRIGSDVPREISNNAKSGIKYLKKNILDTTGRRIFGVTFTLWPAGKFNIEYNYDKPEGYEETDELISGDELNQSLGGLGLK